MLLFYLISNIAAYRIPSPHHRYPVIVPVTGVVTCAGLVVFLGINSWIIGIVGLAIGIAWYGVRSVITH